MLRQMFVACAMLGCAGQAYADRCRDLIAIVKSETATAPSLDAPSQAWCDYFAKYNVEARRSIAAKREYEQRNCQKIVGMEFANSSNKDSAVLNSKFVPMEKSYCAEAAAERAAASQVQSKPPSSATPSPPVVRPYSSRSSGAPIVIPVPVPAPEKPPEQQATARTQAPHGSPPAAGDDASCVVSVIHKWDDYYHLWNECTSIKKLAVVDSVEDETKKCIRQVIELPAGSLKTSMSYHGRAPTIRFQCADGGTCQPKKLVARFGRDC